AGNVRRKPVSGSGHLMVHHRYAMVHAGDELFNQGAPLDIDYSTESSLELDEVINIDIQQPAESAFGRLDHNRRDRLRPGPGTPQVVGAKHEVLRYTKAFAAQEPAQRALVVDQPLREPRVQVAVAGAEPRSTALERQV